jgi:hypothetical protein
MEVRATDLSLHHIKNLSLKRERDVERDAEYSVAFHGS